MTAHLDLLREQARALPTLPGVYFWKDAKGKILYIGKAVDLRARVTSYFSTARHDARTRKLLTQARTIEHEIAPNELEALFRESALIKRELPPFNRALRTPRRFYFLKLDQATIHPYVEVVREVGDEGSLYFGPFRTATIARETVNFIQAVLPLRKCTRRNPDCAPCLYHQMDTCAAPFLGEQYQSRHEEAIGHLVDLLDGRTDRVTAWLEGKRDRMAESLMYERAAEVQQRLDTLREFISRQTILDAATQCRCVLVYCPEDSHSEARFLLVAHGNVVSMLAAHNANTASVIGWVKAHDPVIAALGYRERELDAASVLERWLVYQRERVRWVAIPQYSDDQDLRVRVAYVIGT